MFCFGFSDTDAFGFLESLSNVLTPFSSLMVKALIILSHDYNVNTNYINNNKTTPGFSEGGTMDSLRLFLRLFWDRSRIVVVTWSAEYYVLFPVCIDITNPTCIKFL